MHGTTDRSPCGISKILDFRDVVLLSAPYPSRHENQPNPSTGERYKPVVNGDDRVKHSASQAPCHRPPQGSGKKGHRSIFILADIVMEGLRGRFTSVGDERRPAIDRA